MAEAPLFAIRTLQSALENVAVPLMMSRQRTLRFWLKNRTVPTGKEGKSAPDAAAPECERRRIRMPRFPHPSVTVFTLGCGGADTRVRRRSFPHVAKGIHGAGKSGQEWEYNREPSRISAHSSLHYSAHKDTNFPVQMQISARRGSFFPNIRSVSARKL